MKKVALIFGALVVVMMVLASVGIYHERNFYLEHTLSGKVGQFIRATGRWPNSWEDLEREGFAPYPKHMTKCSIAWHIDPFKLYKEGKFIPQSGILGSTECSVVFNREDFPNSDEVIWLLPTSVRQAIAAADRTNQR